MTLGEIIFKFPNIKIIIRQLEKLEKNIEANMAILFNLYKWKHTAQFNNIYILLLLLIFIEAK